jgi:hypothetical protein
MIATGAYTLHFLEFVVILRSLFQHGFFLLISILLSYHAFRNFNTLPSKNMDTEGIYGKHFNGDDQPEAVNIEERITTILRPAL